MYKKKITSKLSDLTGQTFGRLTVIGIIYSETLKHRVWECKCKCGKIVGVPSTSLTKGRTMSCGCLRNENAPNINRSHADTGKAIYNRWLAMRNRCKHNKKYYVDRGITVCKEWNDYLNFRKDMVESFLVHSREHGERNTTLERIDSNKGYYLENCRWATPTEQNQNTRTPYKITNYKKLKVFLQELGKLKGIQITLSEEEFLTLSYNIRKKIYKEKN